MSNDVCPICLDELLGSPIQLQKCGHSFHYSCINEWYKKHNTCPYCRCIVKDYWDIKCNVFNIFLTKCKVILNNNNLIFKKNQNKNIEVNFVQIKEIRLEKKIIYILMKINNKLTKYSLKFPNEQENEFYIAFKDKLSAFLNLHNY